MPVRKDLQHLLEDNGITSIQAAMRNKDLARLGDPLTNLLFSLTQSLATDSFQGKKISGKTLALALRLAELRHLAPSRLDAHGLGDSVEAMIAYAWIRGLFTIPVAVTLLNEHLEKEGKETRTSKAAKSRSIAQSFAALIRFIWEKEQMHKEGQSQ